MRLTKHPCCPVLSLQVVKAQGWGLLKVFYVLAKMRNGKYVIRFYNPFVGPFIFPFHRF